MYKAILTIALEISAETEEECYKILENMDYEFKYIEVDEIVGKQLVEVDRIVSHDILNQEIIEI